MRSTRAGAVWWACCIAMAFSCGESPRERAQQPEPLPGTDTTSTVVSSNAYTCTLMVPTASGGSFQTADTVLPEPSLSAIAAGRGAVLDMSVCRYLTIDLQSRSCDTLSFDSGVLYGVLKRNDGSLVAVNKICPAQVSLCPYSGVADNVNEECNGTQLFVDNEIIADTIAGIVRTDNIALMPLPTEGSYTYKMILYDSSRQFYTESNVVRVTARAGTWHTSHERRRIEAVLPGDGVYYEVWGQDGDSAVVRDCRCESLALVVRGGTARLGSFCGTLEGQSTETMTKLVIASPTARDDGGTALILSNDSAEVSYSAEYFPKLPRILRVNIDGSVRLFVHSDDKSRYPVKEQDCEGYEG